MAKRGPRVGALRGIQKVYAPQMTGRHRFYYDASNRRFMSTTGQKLDLHQLLTNTKTAPQFTMDDRGNVRFRGRLVLARGETIPKTMTDKSRKANVKKYGDGLVIARNSETGKIQAVSSKAMDKAYGGPGKWKEKVTYDNFGGGGGGGGGGSAGGDGDGGGSDPIEELEDAGYDDWYWYDDFGDYELDAA